MNNLEKALRLTTEATCRLYKDRKLTKECISLVLESGERIDLLDLLAQVSDLIQAEIDQQREARLAIERALFAASIYNSDGNGTGERRALAAIKAYDYALRFFPIKTPKSDPLHLWREMGAW